MEISSQMTKPEARWRRQGVGANPIIPNDTNLIQHQQVTLQQTQHQQVTLQQTQQQQVFQRIDSMTRNLAATTITEGETADDAHSGGGSMAAPSSATIHADGAAEDRLAPLPSEGRFSNSERRKAELKNRKTSTAVAAAAAGLKTLPGALF